MRAARARGHRRRAGSGRSAAIVALCAARSRRPIVSCSKDSCRAARRRARRAAARAASRARERSCSTSPCIGSPRRWTALDRAASAADATGARSPRELTKVHEQIRSAHARRARRARLGADIPLLGEFVIVVAGALGDEPPDESARAARSTQLLSAGARAEQRRCKLTRRDHRHIAQRALSLDAHLRLLRARRPPAECVATRLGVGRAVAGAQAPGGKSGLHWAGCQVTPGRREPTESATENKPPAPATAGKGEKVR